jgi:hypothetical protein
MEQIGPAEQARRRWERARLNQEIADFEARRAAAEREPSTRPVTVARIGTQPRRPSTDFALAGTAARR